MEWHRCKSSEMDWIECTGNNRTLTLYVHDHYIDDEDTIKDGCNCEWCTSLRIEVNYCPFCGFKVNRE